MTDDDVDAMFRPKLDALALLHTLSLRTPCGSSCCSRRSRVCSVRGGWRTTPRPAPSWTPSPTPAATVGLPAMRRQLGTVEVAGRRATGLEPGDVGVGARADGRRGRHRRAAVGRRVPMRRCGPPWSPRTGRGWPPRTAPAERCASSTTCSPTIAATDQAIGGERSSARHCASAHPNGVSTCWPTTSARWPSDAMGLASPRDAGSDGGILPVRHGFADERHAAAVAEREPRRGAAGVGGFRLPDRGSAHRLSGDATS